MTPTHADHPYRCAGCDQFYRAHRHAAKCCRVASVDERTGARANYDEDWELIWQQEDRDSWDAIYARCHFECSCGESYETVDAACACRKCRTYTEEGFCTTVWDRNTGEVVWSAKPAPAALPVVTQNDKPLTHKPFAKLGA
jgi:hypothetical protein